MKKRYKANMKNVKVYSEIAACKMCVALWERIGDMVSDKYSNHDISLLFKKQIDVIKERACYDVFEKLIEFDCPCCEFTTTWRIVTGKKYYSCSVECVYCPMRGFFNGTLNDFSCESDSSPYQKWTKIMKSCRDYSDSNPQTLKELRKTYKKHADDMVSISKEALEYWTSMKEMNVTW